MNRKEETEAPFSFQLSQNYPNPFNPTTIIRFSIPTVVKLHATSLQYVTLKVFDTLGNKIVTLVNEEKQPGSYEVIFDGSNFASGVYFYTLTAGNFSQTKKLLLIK
ncbi:MAG: T9SS type A sorting domain-containing protein [Melioribacteraceae bacterium]